MSPMTNSHKVPGSGLSSIDSRKTNFMSDTAASARRKTALSRPSLNLNTFISPFAHETGGNAVSTRQNKGIKSEVCTKPSQNGIRGSYEGSWLHLRHPIEQQHYRLLRLEHLANQSHTPHHLPSVAYQDGYDYLNEEEIVHRLRTHDCQLHDICHEDQLGVLCTNLDEFEIRDSLISYPTLSLREACELGDEVCLPGEPSLGEIERYLEIHHLDLDPADDWSPDHLYCERSPDNLPGWPESLRVKVLNKLVSNPAIANKVVVSAKEFLAFANELESIAEVRRETVEELQEQQSLSLQSEADVETRISLLSEENARLEAELMRIELDRVTIQNMLTICKADKRCVDMKLNRVMEEKSILQNMLFERSKEIVKQNDVILALQTNNFMLHSRADNSCYGKATFDALSSMEKDFLFGIERALLNDCCNGMQPK